MVMASTWDHEFRPTPELAEAVYRRIESGMEPAFAFIAEGVPPWAGIQWAMRLFVRSQYSAADLAQFQQEFDRCIGHIRAMARSGDTDCASWLMERGSLEP